MNIQMLCRIMDKYPVAFQSNIDTHQRVHDVWDAVEIYRVASGAQSERNITTAARVCACKEGMGGLVGCARRFVGGKGRIGFASVRDANGRVAVAARFRATIGTTSVTTLKVE